MAVVNGLQIADAVLVVANGLQTDDTVLVIVIIAIIDTVIAVETADGRLRAAAMRMRAGLEDPRLDAQTRLLMITIRRIRVMMLLLRRLIEKLANRRKTH